MDQETLNAQVRSRPVRIAYLIEDGEHAHVILDAIFAECGSRWGGRYSLVVPCDNSKPNEDYLKWLTAFDPDIIYSFVDLDRATVEGLHERVCPSYLIRHESPSARGEEKVEQRHFWPRLPFEPLGSLSVTPQYARANPPSAPRPMLIVDYMPGFRRDRFVDDNFGSYDGSFKRWPIPHQLGDAVQSLTLASPEQVADKRMGGHHLKEHVPNIPALLAYMAKHRNTLGVSQLAADSAPRLELNLPFDEAFNLVVGDTFNDRVQFWNQIAYVPAYLGRQFSTLIVSPKLLEDEVFFVAVVDFLKNRNGVSRSSGTPWVTLRSASMSRDQLKRLQERFNTLDKWNGYHLEPERRPRPEVPSERAFKDTIGLVQGNYFDRQPAWSEAPLSRQTKLPVLLPRHLQGINTPMVSGGAYACDVQLSREPTFGHEAWLLPRRLRFHGAFGVRNSAGMPRTSDDGHLTLYATEKGEVSFSLPDDETLFRYGIERGQNWKPFKRDEDRGALGAYAHVRYSDKGRYFLGAQRLLGSVDALGSLLLHQYWQKVLEEFGTRVGDDRIEEIIGALKNRLRGKQELRIDEDWDRVARVVSKTAREIRMPRNSLDLADFEEKHKPFLENEARILDERKKSAEERNRWLKQAEISRIRAIENLCASGVFQQGFEWRCNECFHVNWHGIASLSQKLRCEACDEARAAPVNMPWSFRLHGFLLEALKEHGLLPLVWALDQLRARARSSFYFLPPHDFFGDLPPTSGNQEGEADLLCVVDKRVYLVEAKSSVQGVDADSLVRVAARLRPDVVALAVMEPVSPKLGKRYGEIARRMHGTGVSAELISLRGNGLRDSAFLH